ncbi:MAG TPA: hypothetical protein VK879_04195 [Candidatus Sulfomarinibacteraceae bacterium]|nr:hypothetical protein [Candidatus Sulfomarinibacteraceae bacterium]
MDRHSPSIYPFGTLVPMLGKGSYRLLAIIVSLLVVAVSIAVGWRVVRGDGRLLSQATFADERISPNADGEDDITLIQYRLARNGTVSIYFEDEDGERYYFRREEARSAGQYEVYFSGVVAGYRLPDETFDGEIISRLLQDGVYRWVIEARDARGVQEQVEGQIAIVDADTVLPDIRGFSMDRHEFTPNRDGIEDRVIINFDLAKRVERLRVVLVMPDGRERPIPETPMEVPRREGGRHTFEYTGGVDEGTAPPPDGTYSVVVVAEDAAGQQVRVEERLTIALGGVPYAKIVSPVTGDTLRFDSTAVQLCDTLYFSVTVENYGTTPIRTVGPWSSTVYDSTWNFNTVGWPTESGAWRLGIGFENALSDYPYRWGLGSPDDLELIDGHYYLMPDQRAVIRGGIRVVDRFGVRNPQPMWAGLIHEDVQISEFNNRVDPHQILVDLPDAGNRPDCEERDIPKWPDQSE